MKRAFSTESIRFFRAENPLGVAGGRNLLMRQALGELLVVIDDDAWFSDPWCISKIVDHMEHDPTVAVVSVRVVDCRSGCSRLLVPFTKLQLFKNPKITERKRYVSYYLGTCHALRRSVLDIAGFYQDNLVFGEEELDLSYRIVQAGAKIMYVPDVVVYHCPEKSVVPSEGRSGKDAEIYYHVRNRIWLAHKYLPYPYVITYLGVWLTYLAASSASRGALRSFWKGFKDGRAMLSALPRSPLSGKALVYLRRNYGRLWY